MAQQNIVGSLFGMTPESYLQNRQAQELAQAQQYGQGIGSLANVGTLAAQQGQLISKGVGGLLGVEDPQLALVRQTNQLVQQIGVDTPEKLKTLAGELQKLPGGAPLAAQAVEQANKMLESQATVTAKTREQLPTVAKLQLYRDKLIQAVGPNDPRVKEVEAVIKAEGEGKGTKIVLPGEQQGKELRTANVKQYVDLGDRALTAGTTLQTVTDMNNLINKAFVGVGAGAKLNAAQVANALGISVTGTTESEQLDQLFSALTIGQAKNLKGALSDKDVKFLKEAVGSRGLTKDTLAEVVNRISRDAQVDDLTYQKATEYKSSGGDLADFDFVKAKKEAMADINEKAAKQRRLEELRKKKAKQ